MFNGACCAAEALAALVPASNRILEMGGSSYESGKDNEDGTASASSPVPSGKQTMGNDRRNKQIPHRHNEQRSSSRTKEERKRSKRKKSGRSVDERKEKESKNHCDAQRTHKRARKDDKKKKRSSRQREERGHHGHYSNAESSANSPRSRGTAVDPALGRNFTLADALCRLLENYTALASELPIMLIRLCGGTTFDFSRMPDSRAAESLDNVFSCLQHFGVVRTGDNGSWKWENPAASTTLGQANTPVESELTLVRVIRALLEQIGLSMQALDDFENKKHARPDGLASESTSTVISERASEHQQKQQQQQRQKDNDEQIVIRKANELLQQFGQEAMAGELAGLCSMILEDEIVALSALSNAELREKLELLFDSCGLQVCEMDESSDAGDDSGNDNECSSAREPALGYGLPEHDDAVSKVKLQSVINVCRAAVECKSQPAIKGPMPPPKGYVAPSVFFSYNDQKHGSSSDEDDEGPLPAGAANAKSVTISDEVVRATAKRRARELESAKVGANFDPGVDGNAREEWMLVPGKFDFLGAIKSQSIRSRQFDGKSKAASAEVGMDPKIRAEIRAVHQAHDEARGPSLMEMHREKKRQEAVELQKSSGSEPWKWNRDKDLDAGRRVDKDALNMILGGAGKDLRSKFH